MDEHLQKRLKFCRALPSPPSVAIQILELCEQPEFDLEELCELIGQDPALSARLLRASNSPVYGYRRRATTLKDALMFLGVNAAVSLALTFTLTLPMQDAEGASDAYKTLWQRSALSALVAAETGKRLNLRDLEELFLAALLQDIGMFALLQLEPEHYGELLDKASCHEQLPELECQALGGTHPEVGAWLLHEWRFPNQLTDVIASSHQPLVPDNTLPREVQCVAFSWRVAEYMVQHDGDPDQRDRVVAWARTLFGDDEEEVLPAILDAVHEGIPELGQLFDVELLNAPMRESMLERARELLLIRNLRIIRGSEELETRFRNLEARAQTLQEQARRDPLTGLHSRTALNEVLERKFERAVLNEEKFGLLMVDLDRFKALNDHYGHVAGDEALREVGRVIRHSIRESDFAARYGGDEFVILLDTTDAAVAQRIAERIRAHLSDNTIAGPDGAPLQITASIGMAMLDHPTPYDSVWHLIHEADQALYKAKQSGRNRVSEPSEE